MPIPAHFYTDFRIKSSCLAAGTGLLVGYFVGYLANALLAPFFLMSPLCFYAFIPLGGIAGVLLNQFTVHDYFMGKMRGAFEYVYRESLIENSVKHEIWLSRPNGGDVSLELESLAIFNAIMRRLPGYDNEARFIGFLAAAHAANAGSDYRNEVTALKQAVLLRPSDLVANYRLARAYERVGSAQEAIGSYEAALNDPTIDSEELRAFLAAQAKRVREKGPQHGSPIPGLIYQLM